VNGTMLMAVALGGALGSLARYLTMIGAGYWLGAEFPWGTLAVNVVGSAVMGGVIEGSALRFTLSPEWRAFIAVGVLGGFTTFSAFSMDVAVLVERGQLASAGLYILGSVALSLAALFGVMHLFRWAWA